MAGILLNAPCLFSFSGDSVVYQCLRLSVLHFFFRLHVVCVSVRSLCHSFVDGHLSRRCLLATANAALVVVCILSVNILLCSLGHDSRREIADHMS